MTAVQRLSIGMPVWNGAAHLPYALDALLAQTWTDFELIISDNASTDETQAICEEYGRRDPRIRYVRQPRQLTASDNFAFVFREAGAPLFLWAACDDQLRPTFLARAVGILEREAEVSLVFSNFELYNFPRRELRPAPSVMPSCGSSRLRVMTRLIAPVSNLVYGVFRRHLLKDDQIAFFDFWDVWFGTHMAICGEIQIIPERLFVSGEKEESRVAYPISGKRILYRPYLKQTRTLLARSYRGMTRAIMLAVLYRQVFVWFRTYRMKGL